MGQGSSYPRLVGDVGGTNARFAWIEAPGARPSRIASYGGAEHASIAQAIQHYLAAHALARPAWASIGIATAVTGDEVRMTNHPWTFSIARLQLELELERLLVINDFTALALSLPALDARQCRQIGGGRAVPGAPLALLGAGTGLGVSGLIPSGAGVIPISGEGGHVSVAATDEREAAVIAVLARRYGHVSAERVLSGPGLVNLHQALAQLKGEARPPLSAAQIAAALASDAHCAEVIDVFFGLLGAVAGNLALTLGARGGVYVGGGIVPRLGDAIDRSRFRERFEAKGRFRPYLEAIPSWLITADESPALIGANRALDEL